MIGTLQALRALAALSVLYYHSGYAAFGAHTDIGGVALFFVISGFLSCHIMTTDPTRNGCTFFLRRIKRIAPLYWLATFLILFLAARPSSVPYEHIALSLLFVPHDSVYGAFPVHGVGWTLNIEMACYGLFALSIWLAPAHAPLIAIGLILTVRATVSALASPNTAVALHANALYAEAFVAAIIVWLAWNANRGRIEQWNAPGWLFPAATAVYVVTVVAWATVAHDWPEIPFRATVIGLAALLTGVAVVAATANADVRAPWLMTLGGASYALYLIHTIVQSTGFRLGLHVEGPASAAIYAIVCIALALAIHRWIEPPIARLMAAVPRPQARPGH